MHNPWDCESWSEEDKQKLLTLPANSLDELLIHFPNRSRMAVQKKAKALGRRFKRVQRRGSKRHWTEPELEVLKNNTHLTKYDVASLLPGRSVVSVALKTKALKIRLARRYRNATTHETRTVKPWTVAEDRTLEWMAGNASQKEAAAVLGRSYHAVKGRVLELNLEWRDKRLSIRRLAKFFGVAPETIGKHRDRLRLKFRKHNPAGKPPTEAEIKAIAASILQAAAAPNADGGKLLAIARGEWDVSEL